MNIAVIADDLTGSNVNGALLTAKGFFSATCLGMDQWNPDDFAHCGAVALNTDSRLLPRAEAWDKIYAAVALFAAQKPTLIAKRIDSTLRGNIGAEIEAALAAMDAAAPPASPPAVAVVVPVYPSSGRISVGGYLIVHGMPLERSPIAKDGLNPINSTQVITIIAQQTALRTGLVPLSTVLAGQNAVRAAIDEARDKGCRIIVCDAVTDEDITAIANSLRETSYPLLTVDPGPFTAEVAAVRVLTPRTEFEDRILAVIGSVSELTRRQIETLRLAHPVHMVRTDCVKLLDPARREDEIERVERQIREEGSAASVLGVCTAETADDILCMDTLAASRGISTSEVSERINSALAAIALRLLGRPELRIGGLYTSGGEVTVSTIRTLGGKGFSVRDEVLPLAVYGHLLGGCHPDLPMVTKGGFVGDTTALVRCIDYLFTKISTRTRQH